jgi:hypothetical protein
MSLHRFQAETQMISDLLTGISMDNELQNLALARRQQGNQISKGIVFERQDVKSAIFLCIRMSEGS